MSKRQPAKALNTTRRNRQQRQHEIACIKWVQTWPREHDTFCTEVVEKLRAENAFDDLRHAAANALHHKNFSFPDLECKIAERVAWTIWDFKIIAERKAQLENIKLARRSSKKLASALDGFTQAGIKDSCFRKVQQSADEACARMRERLRKMPERPKFLFEKLIIDTTIIIKSCTGAPKHRISTKLLPPILRAVKTCYGTILPKRGLGSPKTRYYKALTQGKAEQHLESAQLELLEHRMLFKGDVRFSPAVQRGSYLHK